MYMCAESQKASPQLGIEFNNNTTLYNSRLDIAQSCHVIPRNSHNYYEKKRVSDGKEN